MLKGLLEMRCHVWSYEGRHNMNMGQRPAIFCVHIVKFLTSECCVTGAGWGGRTRAWEKLLRADAAIPRMSSGGIGAVQASNNLFLSQECTADRSPLLVWQRGRSADLRVTSANWEYFVKLKLLVHQTTGRV